MTAPREPFDAEEARLARIYGALPGGEPSAALDAKILAQARAAVARAPARRRPWVLGAGLGTAGAAVFAAGIAWQLGVFRGDRALAPSPAAEAPAEELDRIDIEFMKQEQKHDAEPSPPKETTAGARPFPADAQEKPEARAERVAREAAPEPQAAGALAERRAEPAAQPAMAPPPAPAAPAAAPPPPPVADVAPVQSESTTELARAQADPVGDDAAAGEREFASGVAAQSPAGANQASESSAAVDAASDERVVTGSRLEPPLGATAREDRDARQRTAKAALGRWEDDARLAPDAWLERIRERVRAGDRQGAENSLRRFVLAHPDRAVPRELQRLLVE